MRINLFEKGLKDRVVAKIKTTYRSATTVLNGASDIILVLKRVGWKVLHAFCINLRIFVVVFLS